MIVAIKFLINSRVFCPEIRAKIDNARAGRQQWLGKLGSESVREYEKDKTGFARDLFWIGIGKLERSRDLVGRKARENFP